MTQPLTPTALAALRALRDCGTVRAAQHHSGIACLKEFGFVCRVTRWTTPIGFHDWRLTPAGELAAAEMIR